MRDLRFPQLAAAGLVDKGRASVTVRVMRRLVPLVVAMVLGAGVFSACSSSDSAEVAPVVTPDGDAPDATSPEAASADAGLDSPADGPLVDAALAPGQGTIVENVKTPMSCAAVCTAKQFTCGSTTCQTLPGALGVAAYLGGATTNVSSCSDVPAATHGSADLVRVDCCCITPFVVVTGPTPAKDCAAVCAAHGLKCDDQHAWGAAGKGGLDAQYERPSTTAVTDYAYPCTKVPTATLALTKPTEKGQLTHYSCACVAP